MHHVESSAFGIFGQPDHPVERQILRQGIVHLGHVLEADPVLADQLFVHMHDDVLGVDRGEATRGTFSTSQISPNCTMRPWRFGRMSVVNILTEACPSWIASGNGSSTPCDNLPCSSK